jgi:predicted DNA-binding transcriptional regulator
MAVDTFEAPAQSLASFARVAQLCARLAGEEKNKSLFSLLVHARSALRDSEVGRQPMIELLSVAHMLSLLGYLSREALGIAYTTDTLFGQEIVEAATKDRDALLVSVNRALSETQL